MIKALSRLLPGLTILLIPACGSSSPVMKATAFTGSAITGFSGPSGTETDTRQVARDVMDLRTFDFVSNSFTIANGPVTSAAFGSTQYGQGTGSLISGVNLAVVQLQIASTNPAVTDVVLSGEFDRDFGQRAIDTPGATFTTSWILRFTKDGRAREISYIQNMTGSQFMEVP